MLNNLKHINKHLKKHNQEHLLYFYDKLTDEEKKILLKQIKDTNIKEITNLYKKSFRDYSIESNRITPLKYYSKTLMEDSTKKNYVSIGEEIIKNGKIAVLTMAGGQGTRLGYKGPKGCYELDFKEKKSLFEVICDKLKEVYSKYGVYLKWYIMTSVDNDFKTKEYFENKNYFNYPKDKIYFFKQDTLPIVDKNGRIILDSLYKIKLGSNGNGDVFRAFAKHKLQNTLDDVDWISISGIDNIVLEIIDPLFIGLTIYNKSNVASKSIKKADLEGKDYVFAKVDNYVDLVDPINFTEKQKYEKNTEGLYLYNQMNILSHLFSKKAFLKLTKLKLPYHRAFKKNDYIDNTGMKVVVKEPNSFKFEKFIFDAFKYFNNFTLLEVEKNEEFAPIKSFTGKYTPETAIDLYCKKYNIEPKIE